MTVDEKHMLDTGLLAPYRRKIHGLFYGHNQPHILLAAMPKSGSTLLSNTLGALPGFRPLRLAPGSAGRREDELCEQRLWRRRHIRYVAKHHVRFSRYTEKLIKKYNLTVIFLARDLFDVTVSVRDYVRQVERVEGPSEYMTAEHPKLPDAELERMIACLSMPWYINFYMSWRDYPDKMFITYDELIRNPADVVARILKKAGVEMSQNDIDTALRTAKGKNTRLNVGRPARGQSLDGEARDTILKLLSFYPEAHKDEFIQAMLRGN